ncbi:Kelch-like member 33 [Branchiostoma belcheri]|nr:Kelch-like member 33 [Branchiostoma belcheri]
MCLFKRDNFDSILKVHIVDSEGTAICVRKSLLYAQSDYFRERLAAQTIQTEEKTVITLEEGIRTEDLSSLLKMLKTGRVSSDMSKVFRVAGVAKKLRFPSALSLCRERVLCELGESSCASIARTARLLNLPDLETAALEFTQNDVVWK